jgi:DNA-binding transcriptional regulator GbsR (MarR family)
VVERDVIDRIGAVLEHSGLTPVSSKIFARLLVCSPPEQSSENLADYLYVSRGAVSTATRMLMQIGIIERVRKPSTRAAFFRVVEGGWGKAMAHDALKVRLLREIADHALTQLADAHEARRFRLEEFRDFNAFFEIELPALIERWNATRGEP